MKKPITIDFFELQFLAEACIPPVPIARHSFWDRLINDIYYQLDEEERARLFEWITRPIRFDKNNEDCQWFYARYNPENQYVVKCYGENYPQHAFLKDDRYYVGINKWIAEEYVMKAEKLPRQSRE